MAESRLQQAVGHGTWHVDLQPTWGWLVGQVGSAQIQGQDVTLKSDLVLADVQLTLEDVHAWPWRVTSIGSVEYSVDVRGQDLNNRIRQNGHADFVPRLTLVDKAMWWSRPRKSGHLHILIPGLSVTGTVVVVSDGVRKVDFVPDALKSRPNAGQPLRNWTS